MKTELTYLLEQLDRWNPNQSITVRDLKIMIENSFSKAGKDQEQIDESMSEYGHDMM